MSTITPEKQRDGSRVYYVIILCQQTPEIINLVKKKILVGSVWEVANSIALGQRQNNTSWKELWLPSLS